MFDPEGQFKASCDFGWKAADPHARCGEIVRVHAKTGTRAVTLMRQMGWSFSRTTDDSLLRYSFKPAGDDAAEWDEWWEKSGPRSGWGARCPIHANTRTIGDKPEDYFVHFDPAYEGDGIKVDLNAVVSRPNP